MGNNSIRNLIFILVYLFFAFNLQAQKKKPILMTVELSITKTIQYCGGAAPPNDLIEEMRTPKPFENKVIYVRKNSNDIATPILYTITTDANGKAKLNLPTGKYSFVDGSKKDRILYDSLLLKHREATDNAGPIDPKCLMDYMMQSDFEILIPKLKKKATKKLNYNYFIGCNWSGVPCAEFRGQYPP